MFTFFIKKEYLVDHLDGFTDIHNHILPGIDDGAKTVEDSIELLKGFAEFGVNKFICTPHIMHNYYDNTPKTIKKSYDKLKKALEENNNITDIKIEYAAEHMIDDEFEHILEIGEILPLHSNYLLIEMSYLQPSINFDIAIKKIQNKQFFPILAHPERYRYMHTNFKKYAYCKKIDVKFQLNMLSLTKYYGKGVQKIAFKLLNNSYYDFIASDIHNIQQIIALKETKIDNATIKILYPIIEKMNNLS